MSDFLNEIKNSLELITENEYFYPTLIIGAVIIGLFYYYFNIYSVNNSVQNVVSSNEISNCIQKFDTSQIYEFPNMLSHSECDKIIQLSRDKVTRSTVIGQSKKNDISEVRTSRNTFLPNFVDPLMETIDNRIKNIIGINPENYEDLQVVHYEPRQFYKAHWDACDPSKDHRCTEDYKKGGFRIATF